MDGYLGIDWNRIIKGMVTRLENEGLNAKVFDFSCYYRNPSEIDRIADHYTSNDPHFGFVYGGKIESFLDSNLIIKLKKHLKHLKGSAPSQALVAICFGCGSAIPFLRKLYDYILYFDTTREKLLNISEEKAVYLLGSDDKAVHQFLKRFYYVDSQALDRLKKVLLGMMDFYIDGNDANDLKIMSRDTYEGLLRTLVQYPISVKPLYYPVVWGGNWLKKVKNLPDSMVNSGQGFIVPSENAVVIAVGSTKIEIPFHNLVWGERVNLMGKRISDRFHGRFPITYYYDDGYDGGDMAVQVHPNGAYMRKCFNEMLRQDESYYILEAGMEAKTYLGLKEGADLQEFYNKSVKAEKEGIPFDHNSYINGLLTARGDLLLIPAGTVHASGRNQVVLEIDGYVSSYGHGYTFHIYDYLRPNLDGKLRSIEIEHSFKVLKKSRNERWVSRNLKQQPRTIRKGEGWAELLLGRLKMMFYEIRRLDFSSKIDDNTDGQFHMLTLVEGDRVMIQSNNDEEKRCTLKFPDTLLIPACFGGYSIMNLGGKPCKVIKTLIER